MSTKKVTLKEMAEDLGYTRAFGKYWDTNYFIMWENYGEGPCGVAMGWETSNVPITSDELRKEWKEEFIKEEES